MNGTPSDAALNVVGAGPPPLHPTTRAWFVALLGWTTLICFYHLSGGAGFEPIDCWVAQTAREMYEGDFPRNLLVPKFSGETRMQKSPGPYWTVMAVAWLRGHADIDEVSARIPNAFAATILVATIFWLTRRIAGDRPAIFAGFAASSSVLILWWSHRAASDLGLTTFTTLSLASLWIASESEPFGRRRNFLYLLGYFAAGVAMIYKMPMPLAVVGLPALAYVVLRNRWSILRNRIHWLGLLVFLLPWCPWALAVATLDHVALLKWKVEFLDRFTGALPNVAGQGSWKYLLTYIGPTLVYTAPYTLSVPLAFVRAFRRQPGVNRNGTWFVLIWFASLLVFFTASTGKEWRYFLPALPPIFVLLGIELAAFFDPQRRVRPIRDWLGALAVWVLLPAALFATGAVGLRKWYTLRGSLELADLYTWTEVWSAYAVSAAIVFLGCSLAAWLYLRRREHASFSALVATMWAMWLWTWPVCLPHFMSQRPFTDFASQLATQIAPQYRPHLRQVGSQDSRIIWYSNVRFPRVLDQLVLLQEQTGRRNLKYEIRRTGEEMIRLVAAEDPVLFVCTVPDYLLFRSSAAQTMAAQGRALPPLHLWLQARYGTEDHQFLVFGNKPPPYPEPPLRLSPARQASLARRGETRWTAATAPDTAPASTLPCPPDSPQD